jgi:CMP-N,N'-diacetyllegionaminic acid synthase
MLDGKSIFALIPAKGTSEGLPGKNIRPLLGKPMIAWSIEAALRCPWIDVLAVSTDSEEIAGIARACGAEAPFLRPASLATATATSFDVVAHALEFYRNERGRTFDCLLLLEPTSPLRELSDIEQALQRLVRTPGADSIVGLSEAVSAHPAFTVGVDPAGFLTSAVGANGGSSHQDASGSVLRRQDLSPAFFFEGTVYASKVSTYLEKRTFYHNTTLAHIVPKWKAPEVDDIFDFLTVEATMRHFPERYPAGPGHSP